MPRGFARRHFLALSALGVLEIAVIGCGTILHPERRGQQAGPLDWEVVALDAVGLIFFFIPGVIAFAVDFNNGTIYLPADGAVRQMRAADARTAKELVPVAASRPKLTPAAIEETIAQETGHQVRLVPGGYRTKKLERLDQFWATRTQFETS